MGPAYALAAAWTTRSRFHAKEISASTCRKKLRQGCRAIPSVFATEFQWIARISRSASQAGHFLIAIPLNLSKLKANTMEQTRVTTDNFWTETIATPKICF